MESSICLTSLYDEPGAVAVNFKRETKQGIAQDQAERLTMMARGRDLL